MRNPANDADAIEATLKKLDFKVAKKTDVDIDGMEQALTGLHLRMAWCPYLYVCVQQCVSYRLDGEGAGESASPLSSHAIGNDIGLQIRKEAEGIFIT